MNRLSRTLSILAFGASLLAAQAPNPLNLPDPLGISKKPRSAPPAPRARIGAEARPQPKEHRDRGRHRGHAKPKKRKHDR